MLDQRILYMNQTTGCVLASDRMENNLGRRRASIFQCAAPSSSVQPVLLDVRRLRHFVQMVSCCVLVQTRDV